MAGVLYALFSVILPKPAQLIAFQKDNGDWDGPYALFEKKEGRCSIAKIGTFERLTREVDRSRMPSQWVPSSRTLAWTEYQGPRMQILDEVMVRRSEGIFEGPFTIENYPGFHDYIVNVRGKNMRFNEDDVVAFDAEHLPKPQFDRGELVIAVRDNESDNHRNGPFVIRDHFWREFEGKIQIIYNVQRNHQPLESAGEWELKLWSQSKVDYPNIVPLSMLT